MIGHKEAERKVSKVKVSLPPMSTCDGLSTVPSSADTPLETSSTKHKLIAVTSSDTPSNINDTLLETLSAKPKKGQSRRKRTRATDILPSILNDDQFVTLSNALDQANEILSDGEDVDVVLLPPANTYDGDTDNEVGDDDALTTVVLDHVSEVAGHLEVQSSRKTSRISKPKNVIPSYHQIIKL